MFDLSQTLLLKWLIYSILWGMLLGLFYELIRVIKMICGVRYNSADSTDQGISRKMLIYAVTFVLDIAFWLVAGILSILLIYQMGSGVFRGMTYLGLAGGFCIYYFTLGRFLLFWNEKIVAAVKKVLVKMLGYVFRPIKKLFSVFIALYRLTIAGILGKIKDKRSARSDIMGAQDVDLHAGDNLCGKEEYVYVDGKKGYKKSGRISFNSSGK